MGASDLRDAFNAVAEPRYTASKATLNYVRKSGAEYQRLTFYGTGSDGVAFEAKSELLPATANISDEAAQVARKLLGTEAPLQ